MPRLCERPGCSTPADVAYGFDADTLVVWLDRFELDQGVRAGVLCRRHADAMVVPLGWMLDDRREPVPRLFSAARMQDLTDGLARPRSRRRSDRGDRTLELIREAVTQLTLDDTGNGEGVVHEVGPARSPAPAIADSRGPDVDTPLEPELPELDAELDAELDTVAADAEPPASTGSVSEAATETEPSTVSEAASETESSRETEPPTETESPRETESPTETEAQVLPWQPRFDPSDDLSGLLRARGRLLSRAFQGLAADGA